MKPQVANVSKIIIGAVAALLLIELLLHLVDLGALNVWSAQTTLGREIYHVRPQVGWTLKPNLDTRWVTRDGLEVPITTNSMGLRDGELHYPKPASTYRILLMGDSFAEALQLPLADIFPTTLESCLSARAGQPVEVINAGMSAYSVGDEYLFYQIEGQKFDPDLVLLSFFTEYLLLDLDRHADERLARIAGAYRFDTAGDELTQTWLSWASPDEPISKIDALLRVNSRIYQILWHPDAKFRVSAQDLSARLGDRLGLEASAQNQAMPLPPWHYFVFAANFPHNPQSPPLLLDRWRTFQVALEKFNAGAQANGDRLAVMIIPNKYQAHARFRDERILEWAAKYANLSSVNWDLENEPNQTLVGYLHQHNLPTLDLLPHFQAHDAAGGYSLYFDEDLHLNREGHYLTRDLLCNWLIETQLVPSPQ